jgi:hypothetical protein
MSDPREGGLPPTKLSPDKEASRSGDDDQRDDLLPIHDDNKIPDFW